MIGLPQQCGPPVEKDLFPSVPFWLLETYESFFFSLSMEFSTGGGRTDGTGTNLVFRFHVSGRCNDASVLGASWMPTIHDTESLSVAFVVVQVSPPLLETLHVVRGLYSIWIGPPQRLLHTRSTLVTCSFLLDNT